MRDPTYLRDYLTMLKARGTNWFRLTFNHSVLVGMGILGELQDRRPGGRATSAIDVRGLGEKFQESQSLVDRVWPLKKSPAGDMSPGVLIGRSASADVIIPEYSVSESHCRFLYVANDMVLLVDNGSLNGTVVQGHRLKPQARARMMDRYEVIIGRYRFQYHSAQGFYRRVRKMLG